jgi:hypothetical protein
MTTDRHLTQVGKTTVRAVRNTALIMPVAWPLAVLSGPIAHLYPIPFLGIGWVVAFVFLARFFR